MVSFLLRFSAAMASFTKHIHQCANFHINDVPFKIGGDLHILPFDLHTSLYKNASKDQIINKSKMRR
jgi:hypothetical protein